MMHLEPSYGPELVCLADRCPENCCMEWIIDLDEKTAEYYRSVSGEFGEKLRKWMRTSSSAADNEVPEDGIFSGVRSTCFELNGKNCPFLQEDGLCEIRLKEGYEHTSETCREHPYNTECYDGFEERSPSVSCPAVAKLVFDTPVKDAYPSVPEEVTDDPVLAILIRERNALLDRMAEAAESSAGELTEGCAGIPLLLAAVRKLTEIARRIQPDINAAAPEYAFETGAEIDIMEDEEFFGLLSFMRERLSILTERWQEQLDKGLSSGKTVSSDDFLGFLDQHSVPLLRLFSYYSYRYFLKAVNDCRVSVWCAFIAAGVIVPAFLSFASGESLIKVCAWYSREIEHDADNAELMLDYFEEGLGGEF